MHTPLLKPAGMLCPMPRSRLTTPDVAGGESDARGIVVFKVLAHLY